MTEIIDKIDKTDKASAPCQLEFFRPDDGTLQVRIAGSWVLKNRCPPADRMLREVETGSRITHITFDARGLTDWDSGLLIFLSRITDLCSREGVEVNTEGLPKGARKLLSLAATAPEKSRSEKSAGKGSFLSRVGEESVDFFRSSGEILGFIGEAFSAFVRFTAGKARFRGSDLTRILQECGIEALPIVSLISLLVGLILAFVGAVQLLLFGAEIYIANLVGIAMVRVMGAVMTGIIMAGRTGAAFAAQLGTMEVNEEIDAFRTAG